MGSIHRSCQKDFAFFSLSSAQLSSAQLSSAVASGRSVQMVTLEGKLKLSAVSGQTERHHIRCREDEDLDLKHNI